MNTAVAERAPNAVAEIRHQLDAMEGQFRAALPAHIPVERFMRVVMTAIQQDPDLMLVERRSLWNAAIRAAQDGLLPDKREGAMVIFNNKVKNGEGRDVWVKQAQWMPMIAGIRKKVRNSGEIATWEVQVVHQNDAFEFELGDEPYIKHRPHLDGDPGPVIAAYSVATLKSGEKSREVMTRAEIEKARAISRAKDSGPWVNWYEEMCRKTVARRHSKVLPMSTDLDDLIRRDDALYDFEGAREEAQQERPRSLAGRLDALASMPDTSGPSGEIADQTATVEGTDHQEKKGGKKARPTKAAAGTGGGAESSSGATIEGTVAAEAAPAEQEKTADADLPPLKLPSTEKAAEWNDTSLTAYGQLAFEAGLERRAAVPGELRGEEQQERAALVLSGFDRAAATAGGQKSLV